MYDGNVNYKKLIVESGKRMLRSGLTVETWGNISVRCPETHLIYMTPSAMSYDIITEDDIVVCRPDGTVVEGKRKATIENELHLLIYGRRKDVNAVVHTHPVYSMVYAAQGRDIPLITDEAAQTLGDVCRCAKYAVPGSRELALNCIEALGERANSCLLCSHGAVCVGENMDKAFMVSTVLELTAKIYNMIEAGGGKPAAISQKNIDYMTDFSKNHYGQEK